MIQPYGWPDQQLDRLRTDVKFNLLSGEEVFKRVEKILKEQQEEIRILQIELEVARDRY